MTNISHDSHKFDYSKITDNIYLGSNLCCGINCKDHAEEFRKLDIDIEINLTKEENELPPERILGYTWIPVEDGSSPEKIQMDIATSIINEAVRNNRKIYVHCKHGHGRSPTVVIAYFIKYLKMTVKEAIGFVREKRPEIHLEESQIVALEHYLND